jgi:hypothetical protein
LTLVVAAQAQEPWGGSLRRFVTGALALSGLLVTLGGVGIYFGAQMREAGDYPYTRALDDPSFMAESHFNPWRMPIAAHWRMLGRNAMLFARGEGPRITPSAAVEPVPSPDAAPHGISSVEGERLAVPPGQVDALTKALDFWWAYAIAAGLPRVPLLLAAAVLLFLALLEGLRAYADARRIEVAPLPQAPDTWIA